MEDASASGHRIHAEADAGAGGRPATPADACSSSTAAVESQKVPPTHVVAHASAASSAPKQAAAAAPSGANVTQQISKAAVIVQQLWQRQSSLAEAQRQEFQAQVASINQVLVSQGNGTMQFLSAPEQVPVDAARAAELEQFKMKLARAHQMVQESMRRLSVGHATQQTAQLNQTKGQLGGLLNMLQAQQTQLQQAQEQIKNLEAFAGQAKKVVEQSRSESQAATASQQQMRTHMESVRQRWVQESERQAGEMSKRDAVIAASNVQISRLVEQMKLERASRAAELQAHESEKMQLRQRIQELEEQRLSESGRIQELEKQRHEESQDVKARLLTLEEELIKLLGGASADEEDEEEWV